MLKIRLSTKQHADKLNDHGIKAFSQIIPHYNINIEQHLPVTQCYKCYKYTHRTNQCEATEAVCSKCAATGHSFKQCQATTLKCLNCEGEHPAVSFKCPQKRTAQQHQNSPTPAPQQHTSYAQAASQATATPTPLLPTPTQTNVNTEKLLLADILIKYAQQNSYGDLQKQTEMTNALLQANGCPTIIFPENFIDTHKQFYQNKYNETLNNTNTPTTTKDTTPTTNTTTPTTTKDTTPTTSTTTTTTNDATISLPPGCEEEEVDVEETSSEEEEEEEVAIGTSKTRGAPQPNPAAFLKNKTQTPTHITTAQRRQTPPPTKKTTACRDPRLLRDRKV